MKTNLKVWSYLAYFFLEWEIFQTKAVEKVKTNFMFNNFFPPPFKNHVVYEITWKNIVERGRSQMKIWRMRIACWMPKATNALTHNM